MNLLFLRRWTIVLPALMLLFILSACQAAATPAPTQAAGSSPAAIQTASVAPTLAATTPVSTQAAGSPAAPAEGLASAPVDVTFGSGSFSLPVTTVGLADLASYTATLTLSFDGTQAGQPKKWSKTNGMLVVQKPAARQLTITKTGDVADPAPVFLAEVDGAAYTRRGDNPCIANTIVPGDTLAQRYEPAGLLTGVIGADAAGSVTVNGVATDHYTFDERALGQAGIAKSTGELWVASKGGYIVKYVLSTKGTAVTFGEGIEGTLTWDYELTGANQPVTLQLPKDCPAGMVDVPLMPGAADVSSRPGNLTFTVTASLADAAAFYEKQIPTLGWKAAGDPNLGDTSILLDFSQAEKTMTVILTADKGVTTVDILVNHL